MRMRRLLNRSRSKNAKVHGADGPAELGGAAVLLDDAVDDVLGELRIGERAKSDSTAQPTVASEALVR